MVVGHVRPYLFSKKLFLGVWLVVKTLLLGLHLTGLAQSLTC